MERETKFLLLVTVFVVVMTFINLVASKIIPFLGLTISASAFFYALTFPITDVVRLTFAHVVGFQDFISLHSRFFQYNCVENLGFALQR